MDPQAPAVVAVVVTADPGAWLEEALGSLVVQDYPNLSVLVVDAGSAEDPTPRVARVLPTAYVRRLPEPVGYAAAANEAISSVEGATFLLMCHDDVALDPDAVRLLVEEAFRSNAGVVCPKLVAWEDGARLLQVGMSADKGGVPVPLALPGELDQEQHDSVRDVFVAPGGATLIRADLFDALDGFDPAMVLFGEDVDFSWRAQVAGARVLVAPAARARHLQAAASGMRPLQALPGLPGGQARQLALRRRHELRAALKDYGPWHLLRVGPQLAAHSLAETAAALFTGHPAAARAAAAAWPWNLARVNELRRRREELNTRRVLPDGQVRQLQSGGSARLAALAQTVFTRATAASAAVALRDRDGTGAHAPQDQARTDAGVGERRPWLPTGVGVAVAIVLLFGSRGLWHSGVPDVGQLAPFPSLGRLLGAYASSTRPGGLGQVASAPLALAVSGVVGTVLFGATALARTLLVVGMIPLGAAGAYHLAGPLGSRRARVAALVGYLLVPLGYADVASGRWGALVGYGTAPWLLALLVGATGLAPFSPGTGPGEGRSFRALLRRLAAGCVVVALTAAFAPAAVPGVVLVGAGLVLGSLAAGGVRPAVRAGALAGAMAIGGLVLAFPWSADALGRGGQLSAVLGVPEAVARAAGAGALLGLRPGAGGGDWAGWGLVAAASVPLWIGRDWRVEWAFRLWGVALVGWGVGWAGGRGWLGGLSLDPGVVLAPVAAALVLSAALGVVAFERDLVGYGLGWRQVAPFLGAAGAALALVGALSQMGDGRFGAPSADWSTVLAGLPGHGAAGGFRVLWVGDPAAVPAGSWRLERGVAYATSLGGGEPDVRYGWASPHPGRVQEAAAVLRSVQAGRTVLAGRGLATLGIRYVAVPTRLAPGSTVGLAPPADLVAGLGRQLDLRPVAVDPSLLVYADTAWHPGSGPRPPRPRGGRRADQLAVEAVLWAGALAALALSR